MGGLAKMCKIYGFIDITDEKGNKATWVYDYYNDKPVLKENMTKEELALSKKAKYNLIKNKNIDAL